MKALFKYSVLLSFFLFMVTCVEDDALDRGFPMLLTKGVSNISARGATFNAEFTYRGDYQIVQYGFVWATSPNPILEMSDKVVFNNNSQKKTFSYDIRSSLNTGSLYWVRGFVITNDYVIYGVNVSFQSLGSEAP